LCRSTTGTKKRADSITRAIITCAIAHLGQTWMSVSVGALRSRVCDCFNGGRWKSGFDYSLGRTGFELELVADEPEIGAALGDEFARCATLDDAAAIEHDDLVGFAHGAEPMGDHDHRAAVYKFPQTAVNRAFGL